MRCFVQDAALWAAAALALALTSSSTLAEELCSIPPLTYESAKTAYPQVATALTELEKHPIATWYSDRNGDYVAQAERLVATCPESSRLSVVVYGLPEKDCASGESSSESKVKTSEDYKEFISTLVKIIDDRKVLYVVEPDAIAQSLADSSCGVAAGYKDNLATAIELLSANENAQLYLDVGYWTLQSSASTAQAVDIVKALLHSSSAGRVKGIALNTANYRSNAETAALCSTFQTALGSKSLSCVADTSRNFVSPPGDSNEWCNLRTAGIGAPPTSQTGFDNLDYFLWLKPPGDSDGKCDDGSHSADSLQGPGAGLFFEFAFKILWNQGYFVSTLGQESISMAVATTAPNVCGTSGGGCGNEELGAKCCAAPGEYCQPWSPSFYQCHRIAAKCGVQLVGVEFEGEDLATYFGLLPEVCCDTCESTPDCKAYTFMSHEGGGDTGRSACYLKSGSGTKRTVAEAVSAVLQ